MDSASNNCYVSSPVSMTKKESCPMTPLGISGPVSLSYTAALRGFVPRQPGSPFAYAMADCRDFVLLTCLAASNPEGRFFGLVADAAVCAQAERLASAQSVKNISFINAAPGDVLGNKSFGLPKLDYLCADESAVALTPEKRAALFDLAAEYLAPGGIFHYAYRAYKDEAGPLRFLVREVAPEMGAEQANGFLREIKALGHAYFARSPAEAARLDAAIAAKMPDAFFGDYNGGEARSGAFDTLIALRPRGLSYAGDAHIRDNYIDFAATPEAQDIIFACRDNPLYEAVKDFALDRALRADIWCREPARRSAALPELFGGFAYGIVIPAESVPARVETQGAAVELSSPLFKKLIGLMTIMPVGIGDFLAHPDGLGFDVTEIVGAIHVLIACGIAQPMRGMRAMGDLTNVARPRFAGDFNRILGHAEVAAKEALFASPVMGAAVSVPARDILVMQALDRAGLANSVSALLPELERLAKNPALAAYVGDGAPTATSAHAMIEDTVSRSIVQWYAYGLLEAA